jgi:hypothetical protein
MSNPSLLVGYGLPKNDSAILSVSFELSMPCDRIVLPTPTHTSSYVPRINLLCPSILSLCNFSRSNTEPPFFSPFHAQSENDGNVLFFGEVYSSLEVESSYEELIYKPVVLVLKLNHSNKHIY